MLYSDCHIEYLIHATISLIIHVVCSITVPSGPPTNFTASPTSSTSAQLAWDLPHPQQRNGIIRQFVIEVEPLAGQTFSITTSGSSSSFVVSALRPFTYYLFSVAAITIGRGPATQQIQIQTFTDSEFIAYCISGNLLLLLWVLHSSRRSTWDCHCTTIELNNPGPHMGATSTGSQEWNHSTIHCWDTGSRDWDGHHSVYRGHSFERDLPPPIL